ncbi:NACHT domain-containing protein [Nostoc sp. C110]|uniref:NACHT domain-containing protein n=1 Tax=Nostoc sp. C110 TaxID=3349876 RepID=UPI00370CFCD7
MNYSANLSEQQSQFLDAMAMKFNFGSDRLTVFKSRFAQANRNQDNSLLAEKIEWSRNPEDKAQKIQDELTKICQVLEDNGCQISKPKRGRQRKGESPWEQAYEWLWNTKFIEWQQSQKELRQNQVQPEATKEPTEAEKLDTLVSSVRLLCSKKIKTLYSKIQLLNQRQVEVDQLYVDVYILGRPSKSIYASIPDLLQGFEQDEAEDRFERLGLGRRQQRLKGVEFANQSERLMILGKPGAGKSTFLRHLAVDCCKGVFQPNLVPILLELREVQEFEEFNLFERVHQKLNLTDTSQTKQLLENGRILLLLDGLDEVPDRYRRQILDYIHRFIEQYYTNRIILTCRTQTIEYFINGFECVEVADFEPNQVDKFADQWFATLEPNREEKLIRSESFKRELRLAENKQTAELAITPILLSLACWVFQDSGKFPAKRTDLYQRGIDLLLQEWDATKGIHRELQDSIYRDLSLEQRKDLLGYIATEKFNQEQYALFEKRELEKFILMHLNISMDETSEVLRAIEVQHGLLIERTSRIYSFSHLTFQEYFTAWQIVKSNPASLDILSSHITEKRWQEVFLLTFEMLQNADDMIRAMKQQIDNLLAGDEKLEHFLQWAEEKAQSINTSYLITAIRAFFISLTLDLNFAFVCNLIPDLALDLSLVRVLCDGNLNDNLLNLDLASRIDFDFGDDIALALDYIVDSNHHADIALNHILDLTQDLKLQYQLEELRDHFADLSGKNYENINKNQPWQANLKAWKERLRNVMIEHRNIGHDWQFTDEQKVKLQQYYDANKLLVNCINSDCYVSPELMNELSETLLLPISKSWGKFISM